MTEALPKKSLGQHWLHHKPTLQAIGDAAQVDGKDMVLEIGPGTGTLTRELCQRAKSVVAVEFDPQLADKLEQTLQAQNLHVARGDILRFDLTELPSGYKVVANIPYYLTSKLVRLLSESSNPPIVAALLIQKEVARRLVAEPGQMSLLSVSAQYYWHASLSIEVPAKLFTPPPKVDSQVVVLERRSEPLFPDVDTKQFFRLVKIGFSSRRKTLLNTLSSGLRITKNEAQNVITSAALVPRQRPQELSLPDWYRLYQAVYATEQ